MTYVDVKLENGYLNLLVISGHAFYSDKGFDIVCSGISSVVFGILNALVEYGFEKENIIVNEEEIIITKITIDSNIQLIINVLLIQLETIREQYPNYLTIKKQ